MNFIYSNIRHNHILECCTEFTLGFYQHCNLIRMCLINLDHLQSWSIPHVLKSSKYHRK